jgi:hypothetical protein
LYHWSHRDLLTLLHHLIHHQLMLIVRMKLLGLRNASCGHKMKMLGWWVHSVCFFSYHLISTKVI